MAGLLSQERKPKFVVYKDASYSRQPWRWRLIDTNGRNIANSGEGYATKYNCERAIDNVRDAALKAVVVYE